MKKVEVYTDDFEWLEKMSDKSELHIHDLLTVIIDWWKDEHGDSVEDF